MTKQKIFEILLTALLSAGIAFLQTILAQHAGHEAFSSNPILAGAVGGVLRSFKKLSA